MEFVIVMYPTERDVNVGGGPLGKTGKTLKMQAGMHTFDLDLPVDYTPSTQTVPVSGTTKLNPCLVFFTPRPPMRAGAKRAAKNGAKKVAKKAAKKGAKKSAKKTTAKRAKRGNTSRKLRD